MIFYSTWIKLFTTTVIAYFGWIAFASSIRSCPNRNGSASRTLCSCPSNLLSFGYGGKSLLIFRNEPYTKTLYASWKNSLELKKITLILLIGLVFVALFWTNFVPEKNRIEITNEFILNDYWDEYNHLIQIDKMILLDSRLDVFSKGFI